MEQTKARFNLDDYVKVNTRIELFWEKYPDGRLVTELTERMGEDGIFKASTYRTKEETEPASTGHSKGSLINPKSLEKTETVAVGRALANLGFEIKKGIASREEMEDFEEETEIGKNIQKTFKATEISEEQTIPITPKQKTLITNLANKKGLTVKWEEVNKMNVAGASKYINELLAMKDTE